MYEFRPFAEELAALRLGARRPVDWIVREVTGGANPCPSGGGVLYRVRHDPSQPTLQGVQCTLSWDVTGNANSKDI